MKPRAFANRLLEWFDRHGRKDLPWQQDITPYRVWVSEIMLQQTQVATVIPYYQRFIARFPSVDRLAEATVDEVLHQWTGLGYYARARNLHKAAQRIMESRSGEFPLTVKELETLPGIGRSTAGAIAAICAGTNAPILDGNARRVLARCFAIGGHPGSAATRKMLWEKAAALTPDARAADYTQAIMDLGATVCTRSSPNCANCPFGDKCVARSTNTIEQYPGRKPKKTLPVRKTCMLLVEAGREVLLRKRPPDGLWGGLYSLPECDRDNVDNELEALRLKVSARVALDRFRHTFTHFHLDITPMRVIASPQPTIADGNRLRWYNLDHPEEIGLTKPAARLISELRQGRLPQPGKW